MDIMCHRDNYSPSPRILELTYNYGRGQFGAHRDVPSPLATYQPNHEGTELASLAEKFCAHKDDGCPNICESGEELCAPCSDGQCGNVHGG
ncbi:hypothetical protein F5Y06DRAFT_165277 [Hypoxylon sp. FL0890]|nr:hypothetical protein F5Y06DRAFT_165277 [Hypoxylon sp. FL0890]